MSSHPSQKDWLILECQACGSPMKVRAEAARLTRVACPACRSPVPVQPTGHSAGSPEFRAAMPQDSDRIIPESTRRLPAGDLNEEFIPSLGNADSPRAVPPVSDDVFFGSLRTTDELHSGSHIKIKKRRKQGAKGSRDILADWDTTLESLPEAELDSDPWTESVPIPEEVVKEKTRDFVVSEDREGGNIVRRVKRIRKRRLFTWAQLFFRRLSLGMRMVAITAVAAIAVGGVWLGIDVFRKHFKPVTYDDVVADTRPGQIHLTSRDEEDAAGAVKAFLAAVGADAKLKHVRLPKRVQPMMEKWYGRYQDQPAATGEVFERDKLLAGGVYFVLLELEVIEQTPASSGTNKLKRRFAVEETEHKDGQRTYRVDWETAVQWRPMSWEEFKSTRPSYNVPFRIKAQSCSYYNHSFVDEKKWLAAQLYYPQTDGTNEYLFYGYIQRDTKAYEQLSSYIESGYNPALILNLRYPDNSVSADQVIIDSIEHDSWFYTTDVSPAEEKKPAAPSR